MSRLPCSDKVPKFSNDFDENKVILDRNAAEQMLHKPFQSDFTEVKKKDINCDESIFSRHKKEMWGKENV